MDSDSILDNMSTIIFLVMIFMVFLSIILVLTLIPKTRELARKKLTDTYALLKFNGMIRSTTIGYSK